MERKLSLQYRLYCRQIQKKKIRETLAMPPVQLSADAEKENRKRKLTLPTDGILDCDILMMREQEEEYPCLRMKETSRGGRGAILYLPDTAFFFDPSKNDITQAQQTAVNAGRDVWLAQLPKAPLHDMEEMTDLVLALYRQILEEYGPEKVRFYGAGSGAMAAMASLGRINAEGLSLPMPGKLIMISPFSFPEDERQKEKLLERAADDILLPEEVLSWKDVLSGGKALPDYFTDLTVCDVTDFPETQVFFGGAEMFHGLWDPLTSLFRKKNVSFRITEGYGMCHDYCVFRRFPEADRDYEEIMGALRG